MTPAEKLRELDNMEVFAEEHGVHTVAIHECRWLINRIKKLEAALQGMKCHDCINGCQECERFIDSIEKLLEEEK